MTADVQARKSDRTKSMPEWHARFLAMLPMIERQARVAFRGLAPEAREEAVQEAVANALVAFVRLVELGKEDLAYPTPLATYAVRHIRAGRTVGNRLSADDVSSRYSQLRRGFRVGRLDHYDTQESAWMEILVEDRRATPADVAACRIDFANWLQTLSSRYRRIAEFLAGGESTSAAAKNFGVSRGRISQIRRELHGSWRSLHWELPTTAEAQVA